MGEVYASPNVISRLADFNVELNKTRDILFFNAIHSVSQSNPFGQGRKSAGLGSNMGAVSWFPLTSTLTDIDLLGIATGVFDKIDVIGTAIKMIDAAVQ